MLNLKYAERVPDRDNFDTENPFSPTFNTATRHIYIPLVAGPREPRCLNCNNAACIATSVVFFIIIVLLLTLAAYNFR